MYFLLVILFMKIIQTIAHISQILVHVCCFPTNASRSSTIHVIDFITGHHSWQLLLCIGVYLYRMLVTLPPVAELIFFIMKFGQPIICHMYLLWGRINNR